MAVTQRPEPIPVTLADEGSHYLKLSAADRREHFQDHIGIGVFGRVADLDIVVTSTIYHIGGRDWGIDDGAVIQSNLIVSDSGTRQMRDNPYVGNRLDAVTAHRNFAVEDRGDHLVWRAGNRQTICAPPHWWIKGEDRGVEVDIQLTGEGMALPYRGAWRDLAQTGMAGNELLAQARGTVTYEGKTYHLDNAWAVRERMCLGRGKAVVSLLSGAGTSLWGWVFSEGIKMFVHSLGNTGTYALRAYLDDGIVEFGGDEVTVTEDKFWTDPTTGVTYAVDWRITVKSARGALSLAASVWNRCLFGFSQVPGYSLHFGALGRASGRFVTASGRDIVIADDIAYFDQARATALPA